MKSFVDTNVLIYAEDRDAGERHRIARDLIVELWNTRTGVVSVQVLQEFFVNITRKPKKPLSASRALDIVKEYLTWEVIENSPALLVASIGLHQKAQLSFWDASIVQAALEAGCSRLYTEDLSAGQRFGKLVLENPFKK